MKIHPLCLQVPPMGAEEYADLKRDIQENGFDPLFPVIVFEGMILDGRNRANVCDEVGFEFPTVEWKPRFPGDCPEAFILRAACCRRSLTQAQRAALAAEMLPGIEAAAQERMLAGKSNPPEKVPEGRRAHESAVMAAKTAGTNEKYVQVAKQAKDQSPETFAAMKAGTMTVPQAKEAMRPVGKPPPPPPIKRVTGDEALSKESKARFSDIADLGRQMQDLIEALAKDPLGRELRLQQVQTNIENAIAGVRFAAPHSLCKCGGDATCPACKGMGWVTKDQAERQKKK